MSKQSKNCKNVLSFLDHTPERQSHHPKRQARRSGDTRADQRSANGIWDIHQKYAERRKYPHGKSVVNAKLNKKLSLTEHSPQVCSIRDNSILQIRFLCFRQNGGSVFMSGQREHCVAFCHTVAGFQNCELFVKLFH